MGKFVLVGLEFFLEFADAGLVFVEQDSPITCPKPLHAPLCVIELVLGQLLLVHLHSNIPHLGVRFLKQHDHTTGLRVEATGRVEHGLLDEFLDAGVGDGGFVGELVDGAAGLDGLEEGVCVRRRHAAGAAGEGTGR